jgi:hypothetical protein
VHNACAILYCLWPARLYNTFPHYLINGTVSEGEKVTDHKMCVLIFSTILSEILLILCRTWKDFTINVNRCTCKVAIIIVKFSKNTQTSNSIKIHPVASEVLHADGEMELIFTFDNSANAPNMNRGSSFYHCNKHSNSNAQKVCICQDIPRQLQC